MKQYLFLLCLLSLIACNNSSVENNQNTLFTKLSPASSKISFINQLDLSEDFDVFRYRNYYNGGGVAIGDINNDGLPDVYLTANTQKNKLYLNKGNLTFEDISAQAGVEGTKAWSTGVSMSDINGDGYLDIYVCNSGNIEGDNKENELFINQGDGTFKESAKEYGLDDKGFSTHAAFFDFDLDGDLDCYLLNNSFRAADSFGLENIRDVRDQEGGGDKLLRNDEGKFVDISEEAGIYGSVIGFGLGIAVSDINLDGWPDIYISNDFFERDYLYMNNQDGTFKEQLPDYLRHTSEFSMGSDIADLNNDGFPEIFVTDMLPATDYRLKTTISFVTYDVQEARLKNDYYDQFMRNSLQLNNGNGTFSEIGLYAGVAATDWSWGALIADFDNSGDKEIYVTNGIYKDVTNQDFINFLANDERLEKIIRGEKIDFKELVERMPSTKLKNFMFKKKEAKLQFENVAAAWGLDEPSFSNGSAYGDLDNDGDLDLIVNNVNQELFFYKNNSEKLAQNHFIKIKFKGTGKNQYGVGAHLKIKTANKEIYYENFPTRGFQSSMDYTATIGLGNANTIDTLMITWPDKKVQTLSNVKVNQTLTLAIKDAKEQEISLPQSATPYQNASVSLEPEFIHQENKYIDFNHQRLLLHMLSQQGPALAVGDVNNDGLDDFYIGGAKNQSGQLYLQNANGFKAMDIQIFEEDNKYEDVDAIFFDADQDGDLDLYVLTGGSEDKVRSAAFRDRLYLNQGTKTQPQFVSALENLPRIGESKSCIEIADFDKDGDMDIFLGGRLVPGEYGLPSSSYLLENDGQGKFNDVTSERIPQLKNLGLVTDAAWLDYDNDGALDLIIVGEWMGVTVFKNRGVGFQKLREVPGLENTQGLWNSIQPFDVNNDGNLDLILGNLGLNSRFQASVEEPFHLFIYDFDQNGSLDHVFAHYQDGKLVPFSTKHELVSQLNYLNKRFTYFEDFAGKTMEEVFEKENLEKAFVLQAHTFASLIAINEGNGKFSLQELPEEAQFSPVQAILPVDQDGDGKQELIVGGNFSATKPELGKYDANLGLVLKINAQGKLEALEPRESGLMVSGDVRNIGLMNSQNNSKIIIFARNNEKPKFIRFENVPK